jgi:NIMA (never in mitosis gene a)-related kinase
MMASHDFATTYVGTPFYMSPEICAAERYTLKSDIWSLGCIIYELCTKEPPFNAKTHLQLIQKIRDGKFAPLPKQYSPELCEVVRSCLQVNPNRRPDTAMLLNIPYVVLMRKEREIFNKCKEADEMEEAATKKLLEADAKLKRLEQTEQNIRQEIDSQLHREWEVKAALEIKRLVEEETNKLRDTFEKEVQARVQAELAKLSGQSSTSTAVPVDFASSVPTDIGLSSVSSSGEADFSSATDLTSLSLEDSPEQPKALKRTARTPFGRAQTMFAQRAGTPADIEMADPSPMSIASLSLSPRRKGAIKAPTGRNIFADADKPSSERLQAILMNSDSDDDDDVPIPSPTRPMSSKNPFQSANRPKLSTTKTAPLPRPLSRGGSDQSNRGISAPTVSTLSNQLPTLRSKASSGALKERPISPNRRLSRIPSSNNLHVSEPMSSPTRKPSVTRKAVSASDDLNKLATKNMAMKANGAPPRGRSLVELAQARAGGRPLSMYEENSPKAKKTYSDRMGVGQAATYDPATEEMPSPFLIKSRHIPGF